MALLTATNVPSGQSMVVAAVVSRGGRYLLCQRPLSKRHGGLWEFPGGKVHVGETYRDAVKRELAEELGVQADVASTPIAQHRDPASNYMIAFISTEITGETERREHTAIDWFGPAEIATLSLPPADAAFVNDFILGKGERIDRQR